MDALAISGMNARDLPSWARRIYIDADLPGEDELWPWPQVEHKGSYCEGMYTSAATPPSRPAIAEQQTPVPAVGDVKQPPCFVPLPAAVVFSKPQSATSKPVNDSDEIDYFADDNETVALINNLFAEFDLTDSDPQAGKRRGFQPLPGKARSVYPGSGNVKDSKSVAVPALNKAKSNQVFAEADRLWA